MSSKTVAVLIPVLNRPHRVKPLVDSFARSKTDGDLYFLVNENDREELRAIEKSGAKHFVLPRDRVSWAQKLNDGFRRTTEPWMLLGADDLEFVPGWLDQAKSAMTKFSVVGLSDSSPKTAEGNHSTHPMVSRKYAVERGTVDQKNLLVCEVYRHFGPDTELCETAKARGVYVFCRNARVVHLHPTVRRAKWDSTYEIGRKFKAEDLARYFERLKRFSGFNAAPVDTPALAPVPAPSSAPAPARLIQPTRAAKTPPKVMHGDPVSVLNGLIARHGYRRFLQIGCSGDSPLPRVQCLFKIGVDPSGGGTLPITSATFFTMQHNKRFDLIFLRAFKTQDSVKRAVAMLSPGGLLIIEGAPVHFPEHPSIAFLQGKR